MFFEKIVERYKNLDEIWLIARREDRLKELAGKYPDKKIRILPLDLSDVKSIESFDEVLREQNPNIKVVINNAGVDSYDLLNYCWIAMMQEIKVDDYPEMIPEERVYIIFDRVYDYFESYRERLQKIMAFNSLDGALVMSCSLFVKQQTNRIMMNCPYKEEHSIPHELMAEHFSNTIQLMIEWCFLRKRIKSKQEAEQCLRYLLKNIK